jgi:hypothetical protein
VPKGVIVVLVVIAVVFVLTLVLGKSNHGGTADPNDPPGIVSAFKGGGSPLAIEDGVTTTCGTSSSTRITFSGPCSITVPSRSAFSQPKRVGLRPASGTFVVALRPADGDIQGPKTIPGDAPCFSSAVDHKGARIDLACAGGGTCIVDLVPTRSC